MVLAAAAGGLPLVPPMGLGCCIGRRCWRALARNLAGGPPGGRGPRELGWTPREDGWTQLRMAPAAAMLAAGWSLAALIAFPLYFPGERQAALSLGLAALEPFGQGHIDKDWAEPIDEWLPAVDGTRKPPKPAALETTPKPPPVKKPAARPAAVPEPVAAPEEDEVVLPT